MTLIIFWRGRHTKIGTDVEQIILNPLEPTIPRRRRGMQARDAERRVEFVHGAIGHHAGVVLGHAMPIAKARFAQIAAARIDAVEAHHDIVIWAVTHIR